MLFNSREFLFVFLPISLIIFFFLARSAKKELSIAWLVFASLFFYGWWNPTYLGLIFISIIFNYSFGILLSNDGRSYFNERPHWRKAALSFAVLVNLGSLAYFKYFNFFVENISYLTGNSYHLEKIILPLAISFFTFQQIAYLVDSYRNLTKEYNFLHYCLFVTFFPQLIAGPIVHHKEMLPQFAKNETYNFKMSNFAIGLTIFLIGLFKKVALADVMAAYVPATFNAAETTASISMADAWMSSLAYTLQLYFDFSGYSDMAIGLARMFGIKLPLNFDSPYKSANISQFWRRWHMTLSRFLRDYVYISLGGNRRGKARRYINLAMTMVLGGLWHGAGWTFVIWGTLHGLYLVIHLLWQNLMDSMLGSNRPSTLIGRKLAWFTTFIAVVIAWVFFRAQSVDGAMNIITAMFGFSGIVEPQDVIKPIQIMQTAVLLLIAWFAPSTQQIMCHHEPAFEVYENNMELPKRQWLVWRPALTWVLLIFFFASHGIGKISSASEFLYFQF